MKKFLKKYRHLTALLAIVMLAFAVVGLGAPCAAGLFIVGLWQLSQFAMSKPRRGVCYIVSLTQEQVEEFDTIIKDLKGKSERWDGNTDSIQRLENEVRKLRKSSLGGSGTGVRWMGDLPFVTDDCARALTSVFVLDCSRIKGALESIIPDDSTRKRIVSFASANLGIEQRAGGVLGTSDIPLPTVYVPQIVELVFAYGQARKFATVFPLGSGLVKLPRLKAGEDNFGFLGAGTAGQSQTVPQKEVTAELMTFTANKCGGLIRIPTEIEEDTFIQLGQFIARYIARQFAKLEDSTLFLGDGSATYANITGVGPYCVENPAYLQQLGAGKVKPTDATIDDFRAMRGKVNPAVLFNMAANGQTAAAYYMSPTMEALLVRFNTIGQPLIYRPQNGSQPATLDGFPIHWIGVSQPYSTDAAPSVTNAINSTNGLAASATLILEHGGVPYTATVSSYGNTGASTLNGGQTGSATNVNYVVLGSGGWGVAANVGDNIYLMGTATTIPIPISTNVIAGDAVFVGNYGRPVTVSLSTATTTNTLYSVSAHYDSASQ
jgi:Phage capsid family